MKKLAFRIGILLLMVSFVMLSCEKQEVLTPDNAQLSIKNAQVSEKWDLYQSVAPDMMAIASTDLTYEATLCPGEKILGEVSAYTIGVSANWNYYKFYGLAGSDINIKLIRVSCEMDPAFTLFFGTSETTAGLEPVSSYNTDLQYIVFRDDNLNPPAFCPVEGDPNYCFAFWDPNGELTLPYTGWYTMGVYDYVSCGGVSPLEYSLEISGIDRDVFMAEVEECDETAERTVTFTYTPESDGFLVIQGGFTRSATNFGEDFDGDVFEMSVNTNSKSGVRSFSGWVEKCAVYTITVTWEYLLQNKKGDWLKESGHVIDMWTAKLYDDTDPENLILIQELQIDPMWCGDENIGYEPIIE